MVYTATVVVPAFIPPWGADSGAQRTANALPTDMDKRYASRRTIVGEESRMVGGVRGEGCRVESSNVEVSLKLLTPDSKHNGSATMQRDVVLRLARSVQTLTSHTSSSFDVPTRSA
ncbi:hypothetical protein HZH66_014902 [Vespula vulgaris]|uniref:Uncharacterized protein n=1 Tax=Vespula vulgaris TaxID=7454 RepID=A0A834J5S5_VESVU|nr:hypothetical protein HZH66_014902 [Vespula vulgaris]